MSSDLIAVVERLTRAGVQAFTSASRVEPDGARRDLPAGTRAPRASTPGGPRRSAVGVDASLLDATAVVIAVVTLGQLPVGPSVGAAAAVPILGGHGVAAAAAAGVRRSDLTAVEIDA